MKTKLLILLSIFSLQLAISQNYKTVEEVNDACATLGFIGDEDAEIAVDNILSQIGLFSNFTIQECPEINNAIAKNIDVGDGKKARYILYDKDFFNRIEDKAANDWAAISILAHEIGHHLNGHALNDEGSNHKWELEADGFSGFVLARMGATIEDAQSAINTFTYEKATRTHPAKADRLEAISKGWNRGSGKTIKIKEITEEEKKKIVENNEEVISNITAEQVISNYIDAIGGQEKIMEIKTFLTRLRRTSKTVGTTEFESNSRLTNTYLTPNNILGEVKPNKGNKLYSLTANGKQYTKDKTNKKWKLVGHQDWMVDNASYISEYSFLVRNVKLNLLGIETVNEVACYAIEIPKTEYILDSETMNIKMTSTIINYYSIDTGLYIFKKTTMIMETHWKDLSIKDKIETITSFSSISDYRSIDGVLFPFKEESVTKMEYGETKTILEYTDIEVNPKLNKKDFIVKI